MLSLSRFFRKNTIIAVVLKTKTHHSEVCVTAPNNYFLPGLKQISDKDSTSIESSYADACLRLNCTRSPGLNVKGPRLDTGD